MTEPTKGGSRGRKTARSRKSQGTFVTKSGQTIKVHRNLVDRVKASRDAAARRRAARLAGLPKSRFKRFFFHMHPKRVFKYWFSRDGLIMSLKIAGIGIVVGFLILVGVFAYFRKDLPNLRSISGSNIGGSIRYYDRTGEHLLWEDFDGVKRTVVPDDQISDYLKMATIAIEDKDFYNHGGFDMRGIMRAGIVDIMGGGAVQGGSTITQQLVKLNNDWTRDRTIQRKIKELILAVELERTYSKSEILAGYLNGAPYGNVQYGVESASQDYFQKSAKDVTIDEAAFLAAIPKSPSYFSPYGPFYKQDPVTAEADLRGRQHYIIDLMYEQGMISAEEHSAALEVDTIGSIHTPTAKYTNIQHPWFVLTAKEELEARYGAQTVQRGGWKVITTLDKNLQAIAEEQVANGLAQVKKQRGDMIAFASEDVQTGQMVALVGGVDFNNEEYGNYNYATAKIPPGSSIKPYDYAAMIDNNTNVGAGSVLYDSQGPLPGYPCTKGPRVDCAHDYDFRLPGPLTLRYALGGSRNIPAMKAMLSSDDDPQTSVNKTISFANGFMGSPDANGDLRPGIYGCYQDEALTIPGNCYTASAIGDGAYVRLDQNVHGYGTMSRNGLNLPQTYILKIEDSAGKVVDEWRETPGIQVSKPDTAYIVMDMLSDPNASYLSRKPHNYQGWKFSYKTGTTNDSKDGIMMGVSTKYASGVWVGYHDRTVEMSGFMENMTQPILTGYMNRAHEGLEPIERERPAGIQVLPAYVVRTHVGVGSVEPSPSTDLFPSWYTKPSTQSEKQVLDVVSNKLATDCTPERARKESSGPSAGGFSVDKFHGDGLRADSSEQDDVHKCDDIKPTVQILSATTSSVTVSVSKGTHPLSSAAYPGAINLIIAGQIVQSFALNDSQAGVPIVLNYNYSGSGDLPVIVEVVDSVLYDGRDQSQALEFKAIASLQITSPDAGDDIRRSTTTVRWSGGAAPYTVSNNGVIISDCEDIDDNECSVDLEEGSNTIKVTDSEGNSSSVTVTKE